VKHGAPVRRANEVLASTWRRDGLSRVVVGRASPIVALSRA
jgi:hypothetical protein